VNKKLLIVSVVLILMFPLSLPVGWFYARSLPRLYSSYATVQVDRASDRKALVTSPGCYGVDSVSLQTEFAIIESEMIVRPVMQKLGLEEKIRQRSGRTLSADEIYQLFLRQYLHVQQFRNTKLIEITATAPEPYEAALIANAVAGEYVRYRVNKLQAAIDNALTPFKEKIAEQEKRVAELAARIAGIPADKPGELDKEKRNLESQRQILNLLKARYQQEVVDNRIKANPATIISHAEPDARPVKPNYLFIMIVSGVAGLLALSAGIILLIVAVVTRKRR
jgi:uncharacterized protein involved in exopolysaccharide biosynthesis